MNFSDESAKTNCFIVESIKLVSTPAAAIDQGSIPRRADF